MGKVAEMREALRNFEAAKMELKEATELEAPADRHYLRGC